MPSGAYKPATPVGLPGWRSFSWHCLCACHIPMHRTWYAREHRKTSTNTENRTPIDCLQESTVIRLSGSGSPDQTIMSMCGLKSDSLVYQIYRSGFKTPSKARMRRCGPPQNAHIYLNMLRFLVDPRLAFRPDLRFLNHF
jgi:hypothetical protein